MNTYTKGFIITALGVLVITPDTLLIRLIEADTWVLAFWRGGLSGLSVLIGFFLLKGRAAPRQIVAMGWPGVWITLIFALGTLCFVFSITHTSVASTLFIVSTSPVFAALISRFFLNEAATLRTWLTILATLTGIAFIASDSVGKGVGTFAGDLAAVGSALSLAATFAIARARKTASMVPATGFAAILSAIAAYVIAPDLLIPSDDWLWVGLLGLVVVPLGFALLTTGPQFLPAPDVSLLLLLEAVFAPLLVWYVLTEYPGDRTLIGGAIVLGAMAISNLIALRSVRR